MANDNELNLDPITKEPGAHPLGTGLGAAVGGAAAGAIAGALAGPAGSLVGAVVGAVAGGLGGKAMAESANPTADEAYWETAYEAEPYYEKGRSYQDYAPAYRLGHAARHANSGSYDEFEGRLAQDWGTKKELSTLTWPEASAASRAAWNRADARAGAGLGAAGISDQYDGAALIGTSDGDMSNDDVIDTLNDVLESCRDGEYGFRECAEHVKSQDLKVLLNRHSSQCRDAGFELLNVIKGLGGAPEEGGTASGAMHRGWVAVKAALTSYDDKAMLDECERGEDAALARYRKALKENLPVHARTVLERQMQGAQRNHDEVKVLRDAAKAAV